MTVITSRIRAIDGSIHVMFRYSALRMLRSTMCYYLIARFVSRDDFVFIGKRSGPCTIHVVNVALIFAYDYRIYCIRTRKLLNKKS